MEYKNLQQIISKSKTIISLLGIYIIVGLLLITTGSAMTSDVAIGLDQQRLKWFILAITIITTLVLFCIEYNKKRSLPNVAKKKVFISTICMITYLFQFQGDFQGYLGYFVFTMVWLELFFVYQDNKLLPWEAFINLTVLVAIISLLFYVGGSCLRVIPESSVTSLNWGVWDTSHIRNFYNLYYESQFLKVDGGLVLIPRNCGFFSEAPMYNIILCIALAAELFIAKKVCRWKVIILTVTIISTLTTTGYLFLTIAALLYLANIVFGERGKTIYRILYGVICILGIVVVLGIFFHKMTSDIGAGSFGVRSDHVFACLKAWFESPILGVGFENQDAVLGYAIHKQGISVGSPYLFATGGIVLASILFVPYIINGIEAIKYKNFDGFIFETLFLILYFFTAVTTYPILVFYMAYININECKSKSEERRDDVINEFIVKTLKRGNCDAKDFLIYVRKKAKSIVIISLLFSVAISILLFALGVLSNSGVFIYGIACLVTVILFSILICYMIYIRNITKK